MKYFYSSELEKSCVKIINKELNVLLFFFGGGGGGGGGGAKHKLLTCYKKFS